MSLITKVNALATSIGQDIKGILASDAVDGRL